MSDSNKNVITELSVRKLDPLEPDIEIVISGVAGRFPESSTVKELHEKLLNKADLLTDTNNRWTLEHPDVPPRFGRIYNLNKFDHDFFGIDHKLVRTMDPGARILLEHTFEALLDAGVNPKQLRGTNTAVFIASCQSETEKAFFYELDNNFVDYADYAVLGCSKSMLANNISHWLGVHGPSYCVDSACSSSFLALENAYTAIRTGQCDNAIVGGTNLCLHPTVTLLFGRLGVLSPQGRARVFDKDGNGYVRSETIAVMFLQRAKDAKRVYATVVHAKTNSDGFKQEGITYPSVTLQKELFNEFYSECGINPNILNYMEAHGTGTKAGDPVELEAICSVFCRDRKSPLKIGSIKSNLGHSEAASGIASIVKVLLAMESGIIPPNINYTTPRAVPALEEGTLRVITEPTAWEGGLAGVNSFGFGGTNVHILLKQNPKQKVNNGASKDDLPRLVPVSGRSIEGVAALLNDVESRPVDVEHVRLLHELCSDNISGYSFRGYSIIGRRTHKKPLKEITKYMGIRRPIWFIFSGLGSQWPAMGRDFMRFPIFAKAIQKSATVLKRKGIDLIDIITNNNNEVLDSIINTFVGITAIQIGLVDLLHAVGVVPDNMVGHSIGELGCAYADGCLTAEQTILSAYAYGVASLESEIIHGSMATVAIGCEALKKNLPFDIDIAADNSPTSAIISGPAKSVANFIETLQAQKIPVRKIACSSNIPFHSRYIKPASSKLLVHLKQVIPQSSHKLRSHKWITTSFPQAESHIIAAEYSSAEYYTNSFLNSVLFNEVLEFIPTNAITIEIAPSGLLQAMLQEALKPTVTNMCLTIREHEDNAEVFLQALGKLYNDGYNLQLANIYPAITFPVSRGTPMISPCIKWNHTKNWFVAKYTPQKKLLSSERIVDVSLRIEAFELMSGHIIDGRNLVPASGYIWLVWDTLALMEGVFTTELPVVFHDISFHRATTIPKDNFTKLTVAIQKGSGKFEIVDDTTVVVSGYVKISSNIAEEKLKNEPVIDAEEFLTTKDIYKELKLRGYHYAGIFRALKSGSADGRKGKIIWNSNWPAFIDNMMQLQILGVDTRCLIVPTGIQKIVLDGSELIQFLRTLENDEKLIPVTMDKEINVIKSHGVEIYGMVGTVISRRKLNADAVLEKYNFVAHRDRKKMPLQEVVRLCTHIALENLLSNKVRTVELCDNNSKVLPEDLISPIILQVLGDLPLIQPDTQLFIHPGCIEEGVLNKSIQVSEPKKLPDDGNAMLAIGSGLISGNKTKSTQQLLSTVKNGGFLLIRDAIMEAKNLDYLEKHGMDVIVEKRVGEELMILAKKKEKLARETAVVCVKNDDFKWFEELKTLLNAKTKNEKEKTMRIIVVGEQDPECGVLGFVNCLKRESGGKMVRCVFIQDMNAPPFSLNNPLYRNQLQMDLFMNVLSAGSVWGSYRHTLLPPLEEKAVHHGLIKQTIRGDLSSFRCFQSSITPYADNSNLLYNMYTVINFRDVMMATAKLSVDVINESRERHENYIGFEFAGCTATGERFCGFTSNRGIYNLITMNEAILFRVPDHFTMEQAASIPVAYGTCYYALYIHGNMKKGEKILIHAGSGGVGQAAINLALHEGCEIFTTVGTPEKRKFIKETFPSIPDDHIGNSRDTSFEQMIMTVTKGRGVDIVLNSLAEEKLQASVRCLAIRGRFLEIGKYDLVSNNKLSMEHFQKGIQFKGVMLDRHIGSTTKYRKRLVSLITEGFKSGAVKPIAVTIFPKEKIEDAFRFMAAGKHIGKVLLKMREENEPLDAPIMALPQFYCDERKSYVIVGGLGGFGLELADWLVMRNAKNIVLTSRTGIKNGYQRMRIQLWQSYGVKVLIISHKDASVRNDCEFILNAAEELGPVDAIFNLAVILKDAVFTNQTADAFKESFRAKAWATKMLDEVSRKLCRKLTRFVVFSSVSCGRGNGGQTNYGMANSVMERICEKRVQDGLPGLGIQWGAIGDVGLVADMQEDNKEMVIGGTVPQKINSCLAELDKFLMQDNPIVASMVVAEKRSSAAGANNVVEAVMNIMGLKNIKLISHETSLSELGMDSMMAVEIKQTLEREFEVFLTPQDIRTLNFAKLIAIATEDEKMLTKGGDNKEETTGQKHNIQLVANTMDFNVTNTEVCLQLNTNPTEDNSEIVLIPGIDGFGSLFRTLGKNLKCPAVCFQLGNCKGSVNESIEDMASYILPQVLKTLRNRLDFTVVGYSFGSLIAIELVRKLEAHGMSGRLILIDGAPVQMKTLMDNEVSYSSDDELENCVLLNFVRMINSDIVDDVGSKLVKCTSWEQKQNLIISMMPPEKIVEPIQAQKDFYTSIVQRFKALSKYAASTLPLIKTPIVLLKPSTASATNVNEDYDLQKVTDSSVEVYYVEGDHYTMLNDYKVAAVINGETLEDTDNKKVQ